MSMSVVILTPSTPFLVEGIEGSFSLGCYLFLLTNLNNH